MEQKTKKSMSIRKEIKYSGERACFASNNVFFDNCTFENGESPLKESRDIALKGGSFKWRYPVWYCENVEIDGTYFAQDARAGVWYSKNVEVKNSIVSSPKTFRQCQNLRLENVYLPSAPETLWDCKQVKLSNVSVCGDYFALNAQDLEIDNLKLSGKYSFDGVKNVVIRNSNFSTKDAFWNSQDVTVYDSFISGEYIGWNSKNLTFVNCVIESLQGLCYSENLVLRDCKLINTTLAFEYSSIDATVTSEIDSVFNIKSGYLTAPKINDLIIENAIASPEQFYVDCPNIVKKSDKPEWK